MATDDHDATYAEFTDTVNMTAGELEKWLDTAESKDVGQKSGDGESTGHASGRRIVELLRKKKSELDDDDFAHMRKVVGYAHRHLAQKPQGDITDSAWRYSLMNWGHDPKKS
ncbi:DUF3140 domain-containing protein [Mycolicibacterium flavescens]|uniref:DNA-binding protein n=1 Tax=Mycolicibacterium flavescens TaxID=1776 RepID=A0A1E3RRB5_MYCFV|nr:DUF3140 domain-containing protein [Mycolicibacterium flavescens]MCV7279741.1 DUF3140 domain-containing protein [Mycolicibacterium flavescens]ODQ92381.1 DNA-binding protein [Mycolicibacterium flavescens]